MSYEHVINPSLPFFNLPDKLEDIISLGEIEDEISVDVANIVLSNIKSINELIRVNKEDDMAEYIEGGYTHQVLGYSLTAIVQVLYMKPEYIKAVIELFYLDDYFVNIHESVEKQINEILEKEPLSA